MSPAPSVYYNAMPEGYGGAANTGIAAMFFRVQIPNLICLIGCKPNLDRFEKLYNLILAIYEYFDIR